MYVQMCYIQIMQGNLNIIGGRGHLTVHEVDGVREEAFPMSGCFGAHCSVAPTRRQQCEGSRMILLALLLTLDEYSSWRVGRGCTNDSLSSPDYPL